MQQQSMKIPVNMDNKLKFSDRLKALLKTESRQDVDPYVFSEPEPFHSESGKHQDAKSSRGKTSTRVKCAKRRLKIEQENASCSEATSTPSDSHESELADGNLKSLRNLELRFSNSSRGKHDRHDVDSTRQTPRDHTLLYYPRAGDEILDSDSSGDELSIYQRHWFSGGFNQANVPRSTRLSQVRSQLRRRLIQLHKGGQKSEAIIRERTRRMLAAASRNLLADRIKSNLEKISLASTSPVPLLVGGTCGADGCRQISLPCTRHCSRHIMLNADQLLFEHCTAKFSDNTQCCVPVFDVAHELPLCPEHARKRDNYNRKAQESKPKKTRKKSSSPTIPRPKTSKSRPKKRKRPPSVKPMDEKLADIVNEEPYPSPIIQSENLNTKTLNNLNTTPQSTSTPANLANINLGGLGSMGLSSGLKVELGDHEVFAALDPTEHDFGNVLNNLPADAFNDLFIESRNGEYEPSREEEEELERALEAVDKDVRNLERMGQTHGLLEPALLAQLMSDIAS